MKNLIAYGESNGNFKNLFNCLKKIKKRLRSSEEDYFRSLRLEFNRLETKYINTMHMIKEYDEHKRVNYSTAQRKVEDIKENCNKYEKKYLSLKTEYDSLKKRFTEEYKKKKTFALYAGSILTALSQILLASPLSRVIRDRLHVAAALSFIVAVAILVFVCIVLAYIYIKMRY